MTGHYVRVSRDNGLSGTVSFMTACRVPPAGWCMLMDSCSTDDCLTIAICLGPTQLCQEENWTKMFQTFKMNHSKVLVLL